MTSTSAAARRSKRVVASESPERDDDDIEDDDGDEEDDAQGEPDDEYEDMDIDEDDDELPAEVDELDDEDTDPTPAGPLATPSTNAYKTRRASSSAASTSKTPNESKSTPGTGIKLRLKVSGNGNGNAQPPSPTVPLPAASALTRTRPTRTLSNKKSVADAADREGDAPPLTRGSRRKRSLAEVEPEADELASDSQESNSVLASASASRSKKKQKTKTKKSGPGANESGSDEFSDEEEEFVTKGRTVERMTARQRSKHDSAFAEELMVLPEDNSKKVILTEDEKVRRKEEVARRRKLQADQKQENDKREAIDRLLKAQAGRSRNKDLPASRDASTPTNGAPPESEVPAPPPHLLRYISSIRQGHFEMRLALPTEKESVLLDLIERNAYGLAGGPGRRSSSDDRPPLSRPTCAVQGCTEPRKYRCVKNFAIGGCSMAHLKQVEGRLQ